MTRQEINRINTTTLAYLGDAVFEVIVREKIVMEKPGDVGGRIIRQSDMCLRQARQRRQGR